MELTVKELKEWLDKQNENARVVVGNAFKNYEKVDLIDSYAFDNIVIIRGR